MCVSLTPHLPQEVFISIPQTLDSNERMVGQWTTEHSENLAVSQEIPRHLETPRVLLPHPQRPTTDPSLSPIR